MNTFRTTLIATIALLSAACSGKDGITGPQGNANVQIFEFNSRTFTSSLNLTINISKETIDSSVVFVYCNPATEATTAWYPIPGSGSTGSYETRFFLYQSGTSPSVYTLGIRSLKADGTTYPSPLTFRKTRVVLVKASAITAIAQRLPSNGRDYSEMKTYFGLPE